MKKGNLLKKALSALITLAMMATLLLNSILVSAVETENLNALKFEIEWADTVTASDIVVARMGLSNTGAWPLNTLYNGEKLSYEVYIPTDGNYVYGMGGFDGQSPNLPGYWFPGSIVDQNGQANHIQLDAYGNDKWIKRDFTFNADTAFWHLGPSVVTPGGDMTAYAGKKSTVYYKNIQILSAANRVIYDGATALTSYIADGSWSFAGKVKSVTVTHGNYTFKKEMPPEYNPADPTVPTGIGHAVELAMHFKPDYGATALPSGNAYDWYGFDYAGAYANVALNTGDKLAYSIYIPSASEYRQGMGLVEIQTTGNWAVMTWQPTYNDQNGNSFRSNLATTYGTDQWINLEYALPTALTQGNGIQHIGIRNDFAGTELEGLKGTSAYYYINNLRIIHANNTVTTIAPPSTTLYNVNAADDFVLPYSIVRNRVVNSYAATFTYPVNSSSVITGLSEGMDLTALMNGITLADGVTKKVKGKDGFEIATGTLIGTDQTLEIYIGTPLHASYKLLLYGDVNGTGTINIADLGLVKSHILNINLLTNLEFKAGDVTKDSTIAVSDLLTIKKKIVGIGTISQN